MEFLKIGDKSLLYPIIQGGMGVGISLSSLAAHVAGNGGMGIISTAQIGFREDDFYKNPNISFWAGEDLIKHIDKYYPRFWINGSSSYKHYIEAYKRIIIF